MPYVVNSTQTAASLHQVAYCFPRTCAMYSVPTARGEGALICSLLTSELAATGSVSGARLMLSSQLLRVCRKENA